MRGLSIFARPWGEGGFVFFFATGKWRSSLSGRPFFRLVSPKGMWVDFLVALRTLDRRTLPLSLHLFPPLEPPL